TLQEEFIDYHEELLTEPEQFNKKLIPWLLWYNAERPHWALELNSPVQFLLKQNPSLCKTWWPNTSSCALPVACDQLRCSGRLQFAKSALCLLANCNHR